MIQQLYDVYRRQTWKIVGGMRLFQNAVSNMKFQCYLAYLRIKDLCMRLCVKDTNLILDGDTNYLPPMSVREIWLTLVESTQRIRGQ